MNSEEKLAAIRLVCFKIDEMVKNNPDRWRGSLQWVTGQIMDIAKFGDGYPGQEGFPIGVSIGDIAPGETKEVSIELPQL